MRRKFHDDKSTYRYTHSKFQTEMKPHKNARLALKALHIAGTKKSKIKVILSDISQAIESISTDKASIEFLPSYGDLHDEFIINNQFRVIKNQTGRIHFGVLCHSSVS